jgi:hypothetical protein
MDTSDSESEHAPAPKTKRPVPVKALEALAKARQARAEKKQAEIAAKKQTKQTKAAAVEVVDSTKVKNEVLHAPPPTVATPAAVPDLSYLKSLEDKIESLSKKVAKPKKKVIVAESDSSSSDEEIIVRKKKVAKEPKVVVEDPVYKAFKEHQVKSLEREKQMEEKKAERDRLLSLFTR